MATRLRHGYHGKGRIVPQTDSADPHRLNVQAFEGMDEAANVQDYIRILDVFDALPGIQRLKEAAIARCGLRPGMSVLDSGCGIGLETVKLARLVAPSGRVVGLDASRKFLDEARRRSADLHLPIEYHQGDAQQLPFPDRVFDVSRNERLLPYLMDPAQALAELVRVTKPGGVLYVIEPDFETVTINLRDRSLVRKVLHFDCDHHTKQGWIGRQLPQLFKNAGLQDIALHADVVVFEPQSFSPYFLEIGRVASQRHAITPEEFGRWQAEIDRLLAQDELFCTISYFMAVGTTRCIE